MRILPFLEEHFVLLRVLTLSCNLRYADDKKVEYFAGLKVTIDCKPENGEFKTRGVGELDEEGKFKVSLPNDVVKDGKLKEECYAQLHGASTAPCPTIDGLESSKIVFKSKTDGKHTFGWRGNRNFHCDLHFGDLLPSPITTIAASPIT
ncbi:unnamed protein product [Dovyalis caffra]|uniref:Uncharacterized protein n=1 Tax=Dovyalis caffra TaxID=77055 RepID=A0AAV1RAL7_9ROSI|nr:unnamed protein product [Dovyalis caffra]